MLLGQLFPLTVIFRMKKCKIIQEAKYKMACVCVCVCVGGILLGFDSLQTGF